jgi:RNA polymerase sigma-70 factor (ECF subfamily)
MTLLESQAVALSGIDEPARYAPDGRSSGADIEAAYREHYDAVRNLLRRRLDNEDDVAELTQEAYLRVLRYRDCGEESLKRLLLRVAMNLAVSYRRQARHQPGREHVPLEDLELVHEGPSPEESLERDERLERAASAMESLPERCRKVFSLSRLDGMRHRDIARRYGISLRLVEKQITRAKAALREAG